MFFEARFFDNLAPGAVGGPSFLTDVVELDSGAEQRNVVWAEPRQRYSIALVNRPQAELDAVNAAFRILKGRANGCRFRDWTDYLVTTANGRLGTGAVGTGYPTYQLYKRYTAAGTNSDRPIKKPTSGTVTVYRNASPVTVGAGAGQIAIDTTNGTVTFVADDSDTVTAVTPGATTDVTLTAALTGLSIGERLYLSGLTGTIGAALNGIAHVITNIATNVYTLATNTTGLAWTSGGSGFAYPQDGEPLVWAGEFDVPVRLELDAMQASVRNAAGGRLVMSWDSIELIELRE